MTLSAPAVAALARQAADLLDPDIGLEIEPEGGADPYRFGATSWLVWPLLDGHRTFGIYLDTRMTPTHALARLLDGLSEASESGRLWGIAFPACPGHQHEASIAEDQTGEVVLSCPSTGDVVERITPAL